MISLKNIYEDQKVIMLGQVTRVCSLAYGYIQQIHRVVFMPLGKAVLGRNKKRGKEFFFRKYLGGEDFFLIRGRRLFFN